MREQNANLIKVRECRFEVLLLRVESAGHHVDLRLEERWAVDGVGGGARGGERRLRLRHVTQRVVRLALDEVDLYQLRLIVEFLHFSLKRGEEAEGLRVLLGLEEEGCEARLYALPQERALLRNAPLDAFAAHTHLERHRVWDLGD